MAVPNPPPFLTNAVDVHTWLDTYMQLTGEYEVLPNGKVQVLSGSVYTLPAADELENLAVQFKHVRGSFRLFNCANLKSLHGSPLLVERDYTVLNAPALTTLEGIPSSIGESITLLNCALDSFAGLPTPFKYLGLLETFEPRPSDIKTFIKDKIKLRLIDPKTLTPSPTAQNPWAALVNDYSESGDLLTAIAEFEAYFKVPFDMPAEPYSAGKALPSL